MTFIQKLIKTKTVPKSDALSRPGGDYPILPIVAMINEFKTGKINKNQIYKFFKFTSIEQKDFEQLLNINIDTLKDVLILGEYGFYSEKDVLKRLGL